MNQESVKTSNAYANLCKDYGYNPAQAAVAWLLHRPCDSATYRPTHEWNTS